MGWDSIEFIKKTEHRALQKMGLQQGPVNSSPCTSFHPFTRSPSSLYFPSELGSRSHSRDHDIQYVKKSRDHHPSDRSALPAANSSLVPTLLMRRGKGWEVDDIGVVGREEENSGGHALQQHETRSRLALRDSVAARWSQQSAQYMLVQPFAST